MRPFIDALDLSRQSRERTELIDSVIVPALLNYLDERGVEIMVGHNLNTVAEFHHLHPDMPLFPPFDPRAWPDAGRGNTLVLQLQRKIDGVPVGLIGSRRIHVYPDLNKMMRSLEFFYADRSQIPEGEYCIPTKRVGEHIRDNHVSLGGVFYVDKAWRGCGKALARLSRLLTLTLPLWKWSWLCVLMKPANALGFGASVSGFQNFQSGIIRMRSDADDMQARNYWLGSARREDVEADFFTARIADLSVRLDEPTKQEIDAAKREAGEGI